MSDYSLEKVSNTNLFSGDQSSPDFDINNTQIDPPTIKPPESSFQSQMSAAMQKTINNSVIPTSDDLFSAKNAKIKYYSPDVVDKFTAQKDFNPYTFDAEEYDRNLKDYANKETWSSALGKGFDSFAYNFGNTFKGWFADYPKMVNAVLSADWDKMKPDEASLMDEYYNEQKNANTNFVFTQPGEEDDIFSKKFVSEFVGNSGFAMGTVFALGLEFLADAVITAATEGGGIGIFGASGARIAAKTAAKEATKEAAELALKSNVFTDMMKGYNAAVKPLEEIPDALGVLKQMKQAEDVANISKASASNLFKDYLNMMSSNIFNIGKSKGLGELVGNFAKATPLLGTGIRYGEKMVAAGEAGAKFGHLIGMGAQGGRRLMQELNMSSSEAYFEGISTYGDTLDKIGKQFIQDNGRPPSAEEYEHMKDLSIKASSSNYDTNMGVLLVTNHLQFGNLFNKYIPANKFVRGLIEDSSEKIISISSKKGLEGVIKKGTFGTIGSIGKIYTDFGRKEAVKQLGKSAFKNFAVFELSEGLQENIQEITAAGWKDYYAAKFNGSLDTLSDTMEEGLKSQFTKQGWKTFLMGAMTGSLIRVPSKILNTSVDQINKKLVEAQYKKSGELNPYTQYESQLDDDISVLNAFIKNGKSGTFEHKLFNFTAQTQASEDQTSSAGSGLRYEFENGRNNSLLSAVSAANRTNTTEGFLDTIKNTIGDLSAEEFEKQFGVKIEDTNYSSPQQFGEKVIEDIKKYSKSIDEFVRGYKTKFEDPSQYQPGTKDYEISSYVRAAQEEALHIAAINSIKAEMTLQRAEQIANDLRSSTVLSGSTDLAIRVLTNTDSLIAEIGNIKAELALLNDTLKGGGIDAKTRKETTASIKEKEAQIKLLDNWASYYTTRKKMAEREGVDSSDNTIVFAGKHIEKKTRVKKYAEQTKTINNEYHQKHKEVLNTFKKLLISKNKEAGITLEMRDVQIEEALDKIIDYIQLDQDTKDYIQAVDIITDKERFKDITRNIMDGKFKFNLILYTDTLLNNFKTEAINLINTLREGNQNITIDDYLEIIKESEDLILNNSSYIELLSLINSGKFGINDRERASKLIDDINKALKSFFKKYITKHTNTKEFNTISDKELDDINTNNEISDIRLISIANKLFNKDTLTDKELEIYEKFKDQIDVEVESIKQENIQDTEEQPIVDDIDFGYSPSTIKIDDEDDAVTIPTEQSTKPKSKEELELSNRDLIEEEFEDNIPKLNRMLRHKAITQEEYDERVKPIYVIDKLKEYNFEDIDNLTNTISNIISKIESLAKLNNTTFVKFINDVDNNTLLKEIYTKEIIGGTDEELENTPTVEEPIVIEVQNFKPETNKAQLFDDDVLVDINNILIESLKKVVDEVDNKLDTNKKADYKVLETFLPTGGNLEYTIRIQNNKTGEKGSYTIDNIGRWVVAKFNDKTGDYEIVSKPLSQKQIITSAKTALGENFVNKLNSIKSETDKVTDEKGGEKFEKFLELLKKYDTELAALESENKSSNQDKKNNIKGILTQQGTSVELEIKGDTGKEFLLTVDRKGNISLFSEKQSDGSYKAGEVAPKEAVDKLYNKYVSKNIRTAITNWLSSFTGSWAAPETQDGKNYTKAEKELNAELAALEKDVVNPEKNTNFVNEESIINKLKNNKLEC